MGALLTPPKVTSAMSVVMGCQGQTGALLVLPRVIDSDFVMECRSQRSSDFVMGCRSQRKCLSRSPIQRDQ